MIKQTIIDDLVMYVKLKLIGTRLDVYFGRKAYPKNNRGHFVMENGEIKHNRSAPALEIVKSENQIYAKISGSNTFPINH